MQKHHLPQVVEFSREYDVRVETTSNGGQRVVARIKPPKKDTGYRSFYALPFVAEIPNVRWSWWIFPPASSYAEKKERASYFWNEFVRYVRGHQKRRPEEAIHFTRMMLREMCSTDRGTDEAYAFLNHLSEALVAHLRFGMDEGEGK